MHLVDKEAGKGKWLAQQMTWTNESSTKNVVTDHFDITQTNQ